MPCGYLTTDIHGQLMPSTTSLRLLFKLNIRTEIDSVYRSHLATQRLHDKRSHGIADIADALSLALVMCFC